MTAQEFSAWIKEGLGIYKEYKEITEKPVAPEVDIERIRAELALAEAEARAAEAKRTGKYLLWGGIGLGAVALVYYAVKKKR